MRSLSITQARRTGAGAGYAGSEAERTATTRSARYRPVC